MGQTYPPPVQSAWVRKADHGVARVNPAPADPAAAAYTPPDWMPKTWADKAAMPGTVPPNAVAGDPDFVPVTLVTVSSNMPY